MCTCHPASSFPPPPPPVLSCVKSWWFGDEMASWLPVPAPAPSRRLSKEDVEAVNAEMKMQFSEGGGGGTSVSCLASSVWQVWDDATDNENAAAADLFGILATTADDICTCAHAKNTVTDVHVDTQTDTVLKTTAPAVHGQNRAAAKAQSETAKGEGAISPSSSVGPTSCVAAAATNNNDISAEDVEDEGEDGHAAHKDTANKKTSKHVAHAATDDDERERDRKKRNRESAKLSRARKRVRQENIMVHVRELEDENARLSNELAAAYAKLKQLSKRDEGVSVHAANDTSMKKKDKALAAGIQLEVKVKVKGDDSTGADNINVNSGVDEDKGISPVTPAAPVVDAISNGGEMGHQRCGDRETGASKTSDGPTLASGKSPRSCAACASTDAHARVTRKRAISEGHHESAVLIVIKLMTLAWYNTALRDCLRRLSTRVTSPRGMTHVCACVRPEVDMVSNECEPSVKLPSIASFSSVSQSSALLPCLLSSSSSCMASSSIVSDSFSSEIRPLIPSALLSTIQVAESVQSSASCKKNNITIRAQRSLSLSFLRHTLKLNTPLLTSKTMT